MPTAALSITIPSAPLENLVCDSPLGDGHIRLAGDLPGQAGLPHFSVELDRIPVAAGLDALRTVRSGFGPGLEAAGTVSGKITYAEGAASEPCRGRRLCRAAPRQHRQVAAKAAPAPGPLTGSFTVTVFN